MTTSSGAGRWGQAAVWLPGLAVAIGAAVATAHGLFEVAVAARVPVGVAWIYPLITDGLALVAYTATARLRGGAARYAWSVVIVAAGLSGLAQAMFLAGPAPAPGAPPVEADAVLRFGVGAWPAIAAAVVAHLLYLLADTRSADAPAAEAGRAQTAPGEVSGARVQATITVPPSGPAPVERPDTVGRGIGVPPALDGPVIPGPPRPVSHPAPRPAVRRDRSTTGGTGGSGAGAQERARTTALTHRQHNGALPTVRELEDLAQVGRGTAARALQQLRDTPQQAPSGLHLVPDEPQNRTQP
ncbi:MULTISPECIES: hypothetical protein [Pseudonocardia]|jgi:hypothetical protein|uniref:DUF2637 domain-containing protein n=2 Tax=Pseudonocardia TaxID=1847 RepID=A0A1L8QA78_PSEAH|nr:MULTISPECIES: hypothetical protein [Pseudonocardia]OJG04401.1 hypothetical protein BG618_04284 [Pseudonocardia autotrophica]OSY35694.1 hypothetical protein BG845_05905 [Pseudonocardia autotrophica]TDN75696.1 hypothetical protein C8E95_4876 [Pseudonocardia autotrophica]BBF99668.1 hypothetical protein Pdca_08780 [Pseudonocardia autotrophica]GEC28813.1 hypothetical protein PSA01_58420 [Pseudonocardia saturnea]